MTRAAKRAAALSAALAIACGAASAGGQATDSSTRLTVVPAGAPVSPTQGEGLEIPLSKVTRRTTDLFGDSVPGASRTSATDSLVPRVTWDIDVRSYERRTRVAHYVEMFTGRSRAHIAARLSAGSRYEPMIRARMREGGIPEDMYYLALIESGFDPNAYSRAAAVGMWQFMASTARDAGLRVDWWVDERRDPVRSTTAAVRVIRELRDQFGSPYLAAAAYNGGPGRISRGLTKYATDVEGSSRDDAFFLLADKDFLKNETREYVPQLIAAALIGKEPGRYGMTVLAQPAFAYDSADVPGSTPLAAVALAAGAPGSAILELNPHLLRGMTPPRQATVVRLPPGAGNGFSEAFSALPRETRLATSTVESKKGDTAESLGHAHGISASSVNAFNPKLRTLKSGRLAPGQVILLPSPSVASLALPVPDPAIEKFPRRVRHSRSEGRAKVVSAKGMATPRTKQGAGAISADARVRHAKHHAKSFKR